MRLPRRESSQISAPVVPLLSILNAATPKAGVNEPEDGWKKRIQAGDELAFDRLFEVYYADLVQFARHYVGRTGDAEELVLDVFTNIWTLGPQWQPRGSLRVYLYGAVRNRCSSSLRRRRPERAAPVALLRVATTQDAEEALRLNDLRRVVSRAIAAMPERRKMVFVLSRSHGLTYAEVAALLDISTKTVEKHMTLALKSLRERLAPFLAVAVSGVGLIAANALSTFL